MNMIFYFFFFSSIFANTEKLMFSVGDESVLMEKVATREHRIACPFAFLPREFVVYEIPIVYYPLDCVHGNYEIRLSWSATVSLDSLTKDAHTIFNSSGCLFECISQFF